ncbi:MAG: hypothetical protein US98_C0005G0003 [Parcubacteria group bacterium GW2011_GWC1_38_6]|nr:MAG: hypothetical protein US98_C0005G0003 [Parcubacteria group bacterium GW2011_GWC1_38_6]
MKDDLSNNQLTTKTRKSLLWIIGNLYFYMIIGNLVVSVVIGVFSKISLINVPIFLQFLYFACMFFIIRFAVESVLEKTLIDTDKFLKISLIIALSPFIIELIFSGYSLFVNHDNLAALYLYLIPETIWDIVIAIVSGIFIGSFSYFWFKKLSKNRF